MLSHWVLDWVAHAPDLPVLFNRSRRVGLGLQYSPEGTIHWRRALAAEAGLLGARFAINRKPAACQLSPGTESVPFVPTPN